MEAAPPPLILKLLEYSQFVIREPKVIFDVGCADGRQTLEFSHTYQAARVYAFECNPELIAYAKGNFKQSCFFGNISLVEGAVSDHYGEMSFYPVDSKQHWNLGGSSIYKASGHNEFDPLPQYEIKVQAFRLDGWCKQNNIEEIDYLWMDLQGSELPALKGLGSYLQKTRAIQLEVSYKEVYSGQALWPEVRDFLEKAGFVCVRNWPGVGWFGDAIFINSAYEFFSGIIQEEYSRIAQLKKESHSSVGRASP